MKAIQELLKNCYHKKELTLTAKKFEFIIFMKFKSYFFLIEFKFTIIFGVFNKNDSKDSH